jgi:hypothetical protein
VITDRICELIDSHIGPMQEAIGLDYQVNVVMAGDGSLIAQVSFIAKSPVVGEYVSASMVPLPVVVLFDDNNISKFVIAATEQLNEARANALTGTTPKLTVVRP